MRKSIISLYRKLPFLLWVLLFFCTFATARGNDFNWSCQISNETLTVKVNIAPQSYLYQEQTSVELFTAQNEAIAPTVQPQHFSKYDELFEKDINVYLPDKTNQWSFKLNRDLSEVKLIINYSGCRQSTATAGGICFAPEKITETIKNIATSSEIILTPSSGIPTRNNDQITDDLIAQISSNFTIDGQKSAVMNAEEFKEFLNGEKTDIFANRSFLMILVLIILGGLALNLTPCILPMIPINLAIIGAGKNAGNKFTGLIRGSFYGAGMAIAYGVLGLLVALSGKIRFGDLNSSPYFYLVIALIFIVLGIAMSGIMPLDFSRFSSKFGGSKNYASWIGAFLLGAVAALLAGACVAPVVIGVLVLSAQLYHTGHWYGVLLPFVLGISMALPWPLAGAGMSILPKPGQWMVRIKQIFTIIILGAGVYFGYEAYRLWPSATKSLEYSAPAEMLKLQQTLQEAAVNKRPVLIDFWASWCKNCLYMEKTTMKDPQITALLANYNFLKFNAENLNDPEIAALLSYFKIQGLPSFVILKPKNNSADIL